MLYELLTGGRAFTGESVSEILASVLKEQPDLAPIPPDIRPIVERCLRKDARARWQAIGDVRIALEEAAPAVELLPAAPARPSRVPWICRRKISDVDWRRRRETRGLVFRWQVSGARDASNWLRTSEPVGLSVGFAGQAVSTAQQGVQRIVRPHLA